MPLDQKNFDYYTYVSDDGTSYNLRVDMDWAGVVTHDLSGRVNGQPRFIASKSQRPRMATYVDLTTGRSRTGPIGTATAFAALTIGDTNAFAVSGSGTAVTYTLVSKVGEKIPGSVTRSHVLDHA